MHVRSAIFFLIPDRFKTQEMCIRAVNVDPWHLHDAPNHFKTQEISDKAARDHLSYLRFVPDWFVTQGQIKLWHDDTYYCNDDRIIKWYKGYKRHKAQKAQIKKELMAIA